MYDEGDLDVGIISCGQGIGMAHDIPTIKELFDRSCLNEWSVMPRGMSRPWLPISIPGSIDPVSV